MNLNIIRNILGDDIDWGDTDPRSIELKKLHRATHDLLKDEQRSSFQKVGDLSEAFQKKNALEIERSRGLQALFENITFLLQSGYQPDVDRVSWKGVQIHPASHTIPNMLHDESLLYYNWLGRNSSGFGTIIEIGCWLGATTFQLATGIASAAHTHKKMIHAIDSFVWHEDFTLYCDHIDIQKKKPGDDFLKDFKNYTKLYEDYITAYKHMFIPDSVISRSSDRQPVVNLNGPIEYLVQDIAPDYEFNEYIWELYNPFFVDQKTILVYGEYGNFFASSLRKFVQDHANNLIPIHKVYGNVKAFLYRQ